MTSSVDASRRPMTDCEQTSVTDFRTCLNCSATVESSQLMTCDRCGAALATGACGKPAFTDHARELGIELGGLLRIVKTTEALVPRVGVCPAGGMGLGEAGEVRWVQDWGWLASCDWKDHKLFLNGCEADIFTGEPIGGGLDLSNVALCTLVVERNTAAPLRLNFSPSDFASSPWFAELRRTLDVMAPGQVLPDDGMGRWDRVSRHTLTDDERQSLSSVFQRATDMDFDLYPKLRRAIPVVQASTTTSVIRHWNQADGRSPIQRALDGTEPFVSCATARARSIEATAILGLRDLLNEDVRVIGQGADVLILTIFRGARGAQIFFGSAFNWQHHIDLLRFVNGTLPSSNDLENTVEVWWLLSEEQKRDASIMRLETEEAVKSCAELISVTAASFVKYHLAGDLSFFETARAKRRAAFDKEHGANQP
ncbi:MAG: hypothetical protein IPK82_44225 [Polyangiaceae bacterium]|nr:hypothetical protein [Polyangiaceae bacterium]